MRGELVLPMPSDDIGDEDDGPVSNDVRRNIEAIVISWAAKIHEYLAEDSSQVLTEDIDAIPKSEITWWKTRLKVCESIYQQLRSPKVKRMSFILEEEKSAYLDCFQNVFKQIISSIQEARDVCLHIQPLEKFFQEIDSLENFPDCEPKFKPMLHCVCLAFAKSRHYCQCSRIVVLLKEISNLLLYKLVTYVEPSTLFAAESEESLNRVHAAVDTIDQYLETYRFFSERIQAYFSRVKPVYWTFHEKIVVDRLLKIVRRLKIIEEILKIGGEYFKLERIEIAGIRGQGLQEKMMTIFEEFNRKYGELSSNDEMLVPEDDQFDKDKDAFLKKVEEYDRRLATIFDIAMSDCHTIESLFKFILNIGTIISRPIIGKQLLPHFRLIVEKLHRLLDESKAILDSGLILKEASESVEINDSYPPVACILSFFNKLRNNVDQPMNWVRSIEHPVVHSESMSYADIKYRQLIDLIKSKEDEVFEEWKLTVPEKCQVGLNKSVLHFEDEKMHANLDEELLMILKESRFIILILNINDLPLEALDVFVRSTYFYETDSKLKNTSDWYNHNREIVSDVEKGLIIDETQAMEELITYAQENYNWNSPEVVEFVDRIHDMSNSLKIRLDKAQLNLKTVLDSMNRWAAKPMLVRRIDTSRESKQQVSFVNDRNYAFTKRLDKIKRDVEKLFRTLEDNFKLYFDIYEEKAESVVSGGVAEDEEAAKETEEVKSRSHSESSTRSESIVASLSASEKERVKKELEESSILEAERKKKWQTYLTFVDDLISKILIKAASTSIEYIMNQMRAEDENEPLFELDLVLDNQSISFEPSADYEDTNNTESFYSLYDDIMLNIMKQAAFIPRVDPQIEPYHDCYTKDLATDKNIVQMLEETSSRVKNVLKKAVEYAEQYQKYSWLWLEDRQLYLLLFLRYGRVLNEDEKNIVTTADDEVNLERLLPSRKPTLEDFQGQLQRFVNLHKECEMINDRIVLDNWMLIKLKAFKISLLEEIVKWSDVLKEHLVNHADKSVTDLSNFLHKAENRFLDIVEDDDYDGLVETIYYLKMIRDRTREINAVFGPLKEEVKLLQHYGVELNEELYQTLMELPDYWSNLRKLAANVKKRVAPLLAVQSEWLRKKCVWFDYRQKKLYEKFLLSAAFNYKCPNPYQLLDEIYVTIRELTLERKELTQTAGIFELSIMQYPELNTLKIEIRMLKRLWDYAIVCMTNLTSWKKTTWFNLDIDAMDIECKKLIKEIRMLEKEVKVLAIYIYIENQVKNMMASLRAVSELQNPAIRDRHWQELMDETNVKFTMDKDTTLDFLINLNLHNFEEEVKNIVEKAVKEMAIEKGLNELKKLWSRVEFEKEYYERIKGNVLRISEETIDALEENMVQVQNMMGSKFVGFFESDVKKWQENLGNVDLIVSIWFEVQRTWMHLGSIFVGSEDIRAQLPEDSKRFEKIDREFRDLLRDMLANMNIVQACNKPGLFEKLGEIEEQLALCEKALADYLDTKRLAYPRFYFISPSDLLDILSKGNEPPLVCKHLAKLYDSVADLVWKDAAKTIAKGIIAKDGEYLGIHGVCDCSGKVEIWLNKVTEAMRKSVRHRFKLAVMSYTEKPREEWIFDYEAQPALCGTQIWWTTEVNVAFAQMEEGFENTLKDYQKKQISQLSILITLLTGELTESDRQKIMTICTIDVHARDVVAKLISTKAEEASDFQWQSQLRHRWDDKKGDCFANICDAGFIYSYEYLGNTPRLVITPLTDRCYITLTQSLHLVMGGAPAGPAGTGKTETTKDLGRALGQMVYVFNCSEQMDYKSCANIYKGLAQTGAWGCFDEFNRISVEVLSVVSVQVKTVLDAIKARTKTFLFFGEELHLEPSVGMFITMNPGYAGRTELPENLKTLFRPCAMVVPDFELICEIMLVAEGFQEARLLARKFITLYTLCRELLSKQDHYDWGLRAIKSVLVVAGKLKRGDRDRPEDQVLMRALRDFNTPKIVTDDLPVFMGLIGDLFPALDVPRQRDMGLEADVKQATLDLHLQPQDGFILKVVQLEELLFVRHSVFIVGFAGTGKSKVWKALYRTYQNQKRKPQYFDLNPKAVTNDELFGVINPSTREWKDGLVSVLMREQANLPGDGPKWIIFDGDIDPMWIESLNTVMDDNKVLTLASNERIALTKHMRLLFEISNLRTATPATVSRAGILYINPQDLGWSPFVTSWVDTREENERANLKVLFKKYIPPCLQVMKRKLKTITPIPEICQLEMVCNLLDCLMTKENLPVECPQEWYELYFVFACIWGFGSTLFEDQLVDWRNEFSKWWQKEFKTVKFPKNSNVFSFYIDSQTKELTPWKEMVGEYYLDTDIPMQATLVPTGETERIGFFLSILMKRKKPCMLIGNAGTGKSVIVASKLNSLPTNYTITNVPFNYYTNSEMLQRVLEAPLEKKAGRNYGPPGANSLVYFIDDLNMPEVDEYGTVQPHTIIRQFMDYGHWYDRQKLMLKDINNVQFVACMNPTAGSFTIDSRLQRHFASFAVSFPGTDALVMIYKQILDQHLENDMNKFNPELLKLSSAYVKMAINLHEKVSTTFLPTAVKFHYVFNLRDLSNIFQGLLFANGATIPDEKSLARIFLHEATRVYSDKFTCFEDKEKFNDLLKKSMKTHIPNFNEDKYMTEPIIFCHFAEGIGDPKYMPINDWPQLDALLKTALDNYNDLVAAMNLVMFEDAMYHVCRINRIMESPRGNALLVGVGGMGKQSLSRLASYISSLEVFQIQLSESYSIADLKEDLSIVYLKAGLKNIGMTYLMTDSQVAQERFLVVVNDMLASGEIPDLFAEDVLENVINGVRNETKQAGLADTKDNCWKFFIDKVRKNLKCVLCFSPVGATLRRRARQFPAIVNCTSIDWFHDWPREALESVSARFVSEIPPEFLPKEYSLSVSLFMSFVHSSVGDMSKVYLEQEKRHNYTTPKSFLEQISLYTKLLIEKTNALNDRRDKLDKGLDKLEYCAGQVDGLKKVLAVQDVELRKKNAVADKILAEVTAENTKAEVERAYVSSEEEKVAAIKEMISVRQRRCDADLAKAEPAVKKAEAALDTLNKGNLTELKAFASPAEAIVKVAQAVLVLFSPKGKVPKDRSWKACRALMGSADGFLTALRTYDKEHIHPDVVKVVTTYVNDKEFDPEIIVTKSSAAAGLCSWVINIMAFHWVYETVRPLQEALDAANADLNSAVKKLNALRARLSELQKVLDALSDKMEIALEEKRKCQADADATATAIDLANRLVNGLASEKIRWAETVESLREAGALIPGDVLLVTAFISYFGCFTRKYRVDLLDNHWMPYLGQLPAAIPKSEDLDPLAMLSDDAQIAQWNNNGLPTDRMSAENATILTNSARWPLMIDPQLQGIKWIKNMYGSNLKVLRIGQAHYLNTVAMAIANGDVVLFENIGETVDAILDPVLSRVLIKKGKVMRIGDKDIDYNPNFRLILQTKLANPHYKPEMQAQTTLINFTVTQDGLEEQLLGEVVKAERPDLEATKSELTKQQNDFKITLKNCEDNLLQRLASAGANVLGDVELVENLEHTKRTAAEIHIKADEAKITSAKIDEARDLYRPTARRASLLYFILNDLSKINMLYQFSLKAFSVVFLNAIRFAEANEKLEQRVKNLTESITYMVLLYTSRGLFEADKLTLLCQMSIQILLQSKEIKPLDVDFLLRYPVTNEPSPYPFLSDTNWAGIVYLNNLDDYENLEEDFHSSIIKWEKIIAAEKPEREKFPGDWKNKTPFQRLCVMRCLRLDRMTYAVKQFVKETFGAKFIESRNPPFEKSFEETSSITPVFFILSPGVDPLKEVEKLGNLLGFTSALGKFHNVSLGQGQEPVAEEAIDVASKEGHWVILQNIHLVRKWLSVLEKKMEQTMENSHEEYRLFMSAEPSGDPHESVIPQGILESAVKITNEPPTGMLANLHKALDNFTQETLECCTKETEFKTILFGLCYYHAVVAERRRFGPQGWNRVYPFNFGDLTISVSVLANYLENNNLVPWEDLRYLFGEIMYGGHITDDWDRRLCRTYLSEYIKPELIDADLIFAPDFKSPPSFDYEDYHKYIDDYLPPENSTLYGLHPNAEIGFLTVSAENLFRTVLEMQPRDVGDSGGAGMSREDKVKLIIASVMEKCPKEYNILDLTSKVDDLTPYVIVAFQECERMNILSTEIRRSLKELSLGLKGELTVNADMEDLQDHLFIDSVPHSWTRLSYPSSMGLAAWITDLQLRAHELTEWTTTFILPSTVWLAGFFNPQSFLTAIMQQTARKNEWPLDKMCLNCDVTKKQKADFTVPPREGAYIHGLYMEGARWDINAGSIVDALLKDLFPLMPVVYIKAVPQSKQETRSVYECPVYRTRLRGPTFVWTFNLKTKEKPTKWTLAGVAILLQV